MNKRLELWGGVECTVNRVALSYLDQLEQSGHAARPDDLARFAGLGLKTLRYPILWERVQPDLNSGFDWTWTDARLNQLRELGIRPIVGLIHHGSGPRGTDLLDPKFPERLASFALAVARRYPWIDAYTPVNEPLTTARFSALYGHWFPHRRDDTSFAVALLNQVEGVVRAMSAIRSVNPRAELVQTEDIGKVFSTPLVRYQADFENHRRWITFDLLQGRFKEGHPLWHFLAHTDELRRQSEYIAANPCPPDILGVNYYVTSERYLDENLEQHPIETQGGNVFHTYCDLSAVGTRPEGLSGLGSILREVWDRYHAPIALTECHIGCTRDEQLRWLMEAWQTAGDLISEGIDMRAVTIWALLGAFDWGSLVTSQKGDYEAGAFDIRGPTPRPTALAAATRSLCLTGNFDHPVLATPGWWTGVDRALIQDAAPIVILGGAGMFGQALARICHSRGLACRALTRNEADVCDQRSLAAAIDRYRPWAVVNAAGFTLVDEAEFDVEKCFAVNRDGAGNAAALCARLGIPYVHISSDLVFDGAKQGPYVESDPTAPLNVFGQSKAQGEKLVQKNCPHALILRTAALFSPWATNHFASDILQGDHEFIVPGCEITPTYVPDLCQALLELLIDGESGLWHLTNEGVLSWHDFSQLLRRRFDLSPLPVETVRCDSFPALRPLQSALQTQRGRMLPSLENALDRFAFDFLPTMKQFSEFERLAI